MARFRLATNESKPVPAGIITRDIDKEDLVKFMIGFGIEPCFVEGDNRVIWVHFLPEEVQKFENAYLSNKNMSFPVNNLEHANEYWRNAMVLWKSRLRHIDAMASARADGI